MSIKTTMDSHLMNLSEKLGTAPATLSSDGEAVIHCELNGTRLDVFILAREEDDVVALQTPIATIPQGESRGDVLFALMAGNLFGASAKGLTFAVSHKDELIYLGHCLFHPGLTYESFEGAISRLILVGVHWKCEFQKQPSTRLE